jgi:hypothetical protein
LKGREGRSTYGPDVGQGAEEVGQDERPDVTFSRRLASASRKRSIDEWRDAVDDEDLSDAGVSWRSNPSYRSRPTVVADEVDAANLDSVPARQSDRLSGT